MNENPQNPAIRDEDLILYLYGEEASLDAATLADQLARDPQLAARYAELERLMATVDRGADPALPAGQDEQAFGVASWQRLAPHLPSAGSPAKLESHEGSRLGRVRGWAWAAAALLLVAVGYGLGRWQGPHPSPASLQAETSPTTGEDPSAFALSASGRERILRASLSAHLAESERLLTEISNQEPGAASEQAWAAALLQVNRLQRQAALRAGQRRVAAVLAELEPFLLELAHGEAKPQRNPGLDGLQRRLSNQDLLLKLRLTERALTGSGGET